MKAEYGHYSSRLPAVAIAIALALPLHAKTQPAPAPPSPGVATTSAQPAQPAQSVKAAKRPKSDKWRLSFLPVGLQRNPQIDYVIVTELTDAGRKLPVPSFDKPVYYIAHSQGQMNAGDATGGAKDITFDSLQKTLDAALASNGYRPYDPEHPKNIPTQVFFFTWGVQNRKDMAVADSNDPNGFHVLAGGVLLNGDDADPNSYITKDAPIDDGTSDDSSSGSGDSADSTTDDGTTDTSDEIAIATDDIKNLFARAKIVGGQKFAAEFTAAAVRQLQVTDGALDYSQSGPLADFVNRDDTTQSLVYTIVNDCYYLMVYSYDLEALKNKQKKLLWVTRIATTARGVSFEKTLPIMINNGAYYFGRETENPEILRKRAYKNATVDIGEAQVVEFMSGSTATTGTAKPATTGAARPAITGTATGKP